MTAAPKTPRSPSTPNAKPTFKHPSALSRMKVLKEAAKTDEITKDGRSILLHAGLYMDTDGWCFPSATLLAADSGYTEKSVRKALNDLRRAGIILSLPTKAWKLAVGDRAKVPKHLPMMLLWPAATRRARLAALGGASSKSITNETPPDGPWIVTTTKEFGPYSTQDVERFARQEHDAENWPVRLQSDPPDKAIPLYRWYWFAAHLPRAPKWTHDL